MSTYVVSDLHGQYEVLLKGIEEIGLGGNDFLYIIGDAIDRGPDGIKILQHIMEAKNIDLFLGNHEFMMLNSVNPEGRPMADGKDAKLWLDWNSGKVTLNQYTGLLPGERMEILRWLASRKLSTTVTVGGQKYTLCHSYWVEDWDDKEYSEIPYPAAWDMVWRSRYRDDKETWCANIYKNYPDRIFITGHVPVQRIDQSLMAPNTLPHFFQSGNLIDIDGGLAFTDYYDGLMNSAIFYRLDDGQETVVPMEHKIHMPSLETRIAARMLKNKK